MAQSPELVRVFKGHGEGVSGAIFHPLMHQLVSAGGDGKLFVWHFKQSLRPFKFHHHTAAVNDLAVSKDGSFFASAGSDKVVNLWTNNAHGRFFIFDSGPAFRSPNGHFSDLGDAIGRGVSEESSMWGCSGHNGTDPRGREHLG